MRLSQFIAALAADLEANGDAENVMIGLVVPCEDGNRYRLDAVLSGDEVPVIRDSNFVNGMACIAADYKGNTQVEVAW